MNEEDSIIKLTSQRIKELQNKKIEESLTGKEYLELANLEYKLKNNSIGIKETKSKPKKKRETLLWKLIFWIREKLISLIVYLIFIAIFIVIFILPRIEEIKEAPDYAIVYVNVQNHEYYSPPCVERVLKALPEISRSGFLKKTTIEEAEATGFIKNSLCLELGGFHDNPKSIINILLEKIGVGESRWTTQGEWIW